ncbi:MAG: SulP family inorganic anion transporter [Magnetococcales bacterium]|nr:SulP family inorganic anion transporter [Magnetococcales bacterium]MBF0437998.1 SulP family inorganic anion transporter [Magnetococcales bacterium]
MFNRSLRTLFPPLQWWHRVTPNTLKADLIAGLTGAIVVLPQGVAFAAIAGMPPVYGLYAGMIPAIVAALFGSSWHLVSGPTTAASIVLFSLLSIHAEPGSAAYVQLALTMTFLVGLTQFALGLIRLGSLVNFISHSVVIGFTSGAAILISINQIHYFFGIDIPKGSDFIHTLLIFYQQLGSINPQIVLVSCTTLLIGIACRLWLPRIPYMIVALSMGSLTALTIDATMTTPSGITWVEAMSSSLPPLSMPDFSLATLRTLAPGVIAVTLLALTEAISIARAMSLRSGQTLNADQEFIAQGLSNLVGSFFSSYVATGSFNRSGLNYEAGAKTPIAAASSGLILIGLVMLVGPLASVLPHAAMAGVLFLVAWGLIDWHHIHQTLRTSRSETIILTATFLATLFFNLEIAILFGVMLSLGIYLARTSNPNVVSRVPDPDHPRRRFTSSPTLPECPKVRVVRVDGSLFFAAIGSIQKQIDALADLSVHLVIVASGINFIDLAGAEFLAMEATKRRQAGGGLYLVRLKETPYSLLEKGGYWQTIGKENLFASKQEAIQAIFSKMNPTQCSSCTLRVFRECGPLSKTEQLPWRRPLFPTNKAA